MTHFAGLKKNDATNCAEGICVSLWTQGCPQPHRCPGCHNPETWDPEGGYEIPSDLRGQIIKAISANGVQRNFSILGGEPLCNGNAEMVLEILTSVRIAYPKIRIFLWTGYTMDYLLASNSSIISSILEKIDVVIDGPFEKEKRDITLALRGSSNQHIWEKNEDGDWKIQDAKYDN